MTPTGARIVRNVSLAFVACLLGAIAPAQPARDALATEFTTTVRPLLKQYCTRCHSDRRTEAEVNLARFDSLADVRKQTRVWQKVAEMLETRQMPPEGERRPSEQDHARLREWVTKFLKSEARATAGDPGRVVLRRLSNAEYTYTLHDLTGVDSLRPAKGSPTSATGWSCRRRS